MSTTVLLRAATATSTLPSNFQPYGGINGTPLPSIEAAGDVLTFVAYGIGTGTWSATVTVYPIQLDINDATKYVTLEPMVFNVTNTTPAASIAASTAQREFYAIVTAVTGTVSISALAKG